MIRNFGKRKACIWYIINYLNKRNYDIQLAPVIISNPSSAESMWNSQLEKINFFERHIALKSLALLRSPLLWLIFYLSKYIDKWQRNMQNPLKSHMKNNRLLKLIYSRMDYFKSFILPGTNSLIHKVIYLFFPLKVVPSGDYMQAFNDFSLLYFLHCGQKHLTLFPTLFVWEYSFLLDLSIVFNFVSPKGNIKSSV